MCAETANPRTKPPNGSIHKPRQPKPVLATEPSAALRDQLIGEINELKDSDDIALWAHRRLPAKNTLTADDARAGETACQVVLSALNLGRDELEQFPDGAAEVEPTTATNGDAGAVPPMTAATTAEDQHPEAMVTPFPKSMRRRNKAHLAF